MKKRIPLIFILLLLIVTSLLSGLKLFGFYLEKKNYNKVQEEITSIFDSAVEEYPIDDRQNDEEDELESEELKKLVFEDVKDINEDLVGWIKIGGTVIDYPVLQSNDNLYYMSRNIFDEKSNYGSIFADVKSDINRPSENIILYGHHMRNGTMFGSLKSYEKKSFYDNHKVIDFHTLDTHSKYEIIGVFKTTVYNTSDDEFPYYLYINIRSEKLFNEFIAKVKELSFYETGLEAQYGDELLTLSTCEYSSDNGRLVVVAKKISEEVMTNN